ncbi:TauD/TfdA dioxygenase family protein [Novosphingobium sp.]|uniref:TauD/TfdA dioxygenase family protein n=1 Tax=Novosphingobium sp. TaxID=1874826 RepID=UPI0035B4AA40
MQLRPLSDHVGTEVTGIAMTDLDDAAFEQLRQLVYDRGMVALRDQTLTPEQHIAFANRWGGIDINNYFPLNGQHPEIAEVRKEADQRVNIGGGWHTDHSYDQIPAMGSILVARELPSSGGDTLFSSMGAAYDALSEGLKATLERLNAVHSADHIYSREGAYAQTDQASVLRGHELKTLAVHPVIIRHPVTGRKLLYVNGAFTLHFEGWTREESQPLLQYLYSLGTREEFQCRLEWRPGTVAIWDNRATWHLAQNDYHGERRVMHRITLTGEPIGR